MTVGVFRDESPNQVVQSVERGGLRGASSTVTSRPNRWVAERVRFVVKAFAAGAPELDHVARLRRHAVLLDAPTPGSGEVFDWSLAEAPPNHRVILAGGLDPGQRGRRRRAGGALGRRRLHRRRAAPGRKDPRPAPLRGRRPSAAPPEPQHADGACPTTGATTAERSVTCR